MSKAKKPTRQQPEECEEYEDDGARMIDRGSIVERMTPAQMKRVAGGIKSALARRKKETGEPEPPRPARPDFDAAFVTHVARQIGISEEQVRKEIGTM